MKKRKEKCEKQKSKNEKKRISHSSQQHHRLCNPPLRNPERVQQHNNKQNNFTAFPILSCLPPILQVPYSPNTLLYIDLHQRQLLVPIAEPNYQCGQLTTLLTVLNLRLSLTFSTILEPKNHDRILSQTTACQLYRSISPQSLLYPLSFYSLIKTKDELWRFKSNVLDTKPTFQVNQTLFWS